MPTDSLAFAVTSGLGVGVIAGIVSGVCYILVYGVTQTRKRKSRTHWQCIVCGSQFRSIVGVLDVGRVVTCSKCQERVCRTGCATRDPRQGWLCQLCQHPESWFKGILTALQPNSVKAAHIFKSTMDPDAIEEVDEDVETVKTRQKEQVRDFIERLVETMLGGNVDSTSIGKIYNDTQYLPVVGQSPCSAHTSLKQLIQNVIREAVGMPHLSQKVEMHPDATVDVNDTNRTYEDLLATAILNKVIQTYQDELPSSSASVSSKISSSSKNGNDKEYYFGGETLETKWKNGGSVADVDTTSMSSLEEWIRSDSSVGSTKYVDQMSLTIQQRIEEVSTSEDEEEEEGPQVIHTNSLLKPDTESQEWLDNWLMQKRRYGGSASPVPVPMLVPNPTVDAKVLIGDREAEDTTDLSDAASDFGDTESAQDIKTILVDSKTVIGGKNLLDHVNLTDNNISDDSSTDVSDLEQERDDVIKQFMANGHHKDEIDGLEDIIRTATKDSDELLMSLDSNQEKDTEYTEKYASLPRTIYKKVPLATRESQNGLEQHTESSTENKEEIEKPLQNGHTHKQDEKPAQNGHKHQKMSDSDDDKTELFKGSYSEREKEKWKYAVEMKNNPYSPENLNRRLSSHNSDRSTSPFGADYYVREASKPTGARKKKFNTDDDMEQPEGNDTWAETEEDPTSPIPEDFQQEGQGDNHIEVKEEPDKGVETPVEDDSSVERKAPFPPIKDYHPRGRDASWLESECSAASTEKEIEEVQISTSEKDMLPKVNEDVCTKKDATIISTAYIEVRNDDYAEVQEVCVSFSSEEPNSKEINNVLTDEDVTDCSKMEDTSLQSQHETWVETEELSVSPTKKDYDSKDSIDELADSSTKDEPVAKSSPEDNIAVRAEPIILHCEPGQSDDESSIEPLSPQTLNPSIIDISSDSDRSIERTYNVETGTILVKVGDENREVVNGTTSPEGIFYKPLDADNVFNDNVTVDENHNTNIAARKIEFLRSITQSDDDIYSPPPIDITLFENLDDNIFAEPPALPPNHPNAIQYDTTDMVTAILVNVQEEVVENQKSNENILETFLLETDEHQIADSAKEVQFLDKTSNLEHMEKIESLEETKNLGNTQNLKKTETDIAFDNPEDGHNEIEQKIIKPTRASELNREIISVEEKQLVKKLVEDLKKNINIESKNSNNLKKENKNWEYKISPYSKAPSNKTKTLSYSDDEILTESKDTSLGYSSDNYEYDANSRSASSLDRDLEIIDLKERKSVNIEFSSKREIKNDEKSPTLNILGQEPLMAQLPSVKNLKKMFDKNDELGNKKKDKPVYSLTARSIPPRFRQELKRQETETNHKQENGTDRSVNSPSSPTTNTTESIPFQVEPNQEFIATKDIIKFYENLKQ